MSTEPGRAHAQPRHRERRSANPAWPLVRTVTAGGSEAVLWPDPGNPRAAVYVIYPVGSRLELPEPTGLAHFLEHMMFNGTTRFPDDAFDRILEDLGGSNNAYTSEEITVYQNLVPADAVGRVLELEADRREHLVIEPARVDRERGVILSEREASIDNDPVARFLEEVQAVACAGSSYASPVIGWRDDIARIDAGWLGRFYQRHYEMGTPSIVGVGGIDPDDWAHLLETYWQRPTGVNRPPPVVPRGPGQPLGERRIEAQGPVSAPYLVLGFPAPAGADPAAWAHELLWTLLVGGVASRLHARLVEDRNLALDLDLFRVGATVPGCQFLGITVSPRRRTRTVEALVREELDRLVGEGPSEAERERALNQRLAAHERHLESVAGRAELVGRSLFIHRDPGALAEYPARLHAVSCEEIRRAAEAAFAGGGWTVGTLHPDATRAIPSGSA